MLTLAVVLGLAAMAIAIYSAVKPANILWIAVVLLSIIVVVERVPFK